MNPKLALALVCVCVPCWAQTSPAGAAPPAPAAVSVGGVQPPIAEPSEPNVKHTVIEDKGSKIDELRVRGQLTHVIVTPKVGITKSYELIVSRSGREPPDGTGGANTDVGKRVWNVLNF
jgi:hypothetical protein